MWIISPVFFGFVGAGLMLVLGFVMAMGGMAGPVPPTENLPMFLATIPLSFISAFLIRRTGFAKAILGALFFTLPIFLFCHWCASDVTGREPEKQARAIYQVAYITLGFAVSSSLLFATAAHPSVRRKNAKHAA